MALLGLAWAGTRHRPGSWLLLALGVALAAALPIVAAGLRVESTVAAVRSAIETLPPAQRAVLAVTGIDVRGDELAATDATVRDGFAGVAVGDVAQTLTFRPLSAGAQQLTLGATTGLDRAVRLTEGRLPTACPPTACEVLVVTIPGGAIPEASYARATAELGLVVTGRAELLDQRPVGTGLVPSDAGLLLGGDPAALAGLESLALFGRNTGWVGTLDPAAVSTLGADRFTALLTALSGEVSATTGPLSVAWPSDQVNEAAARAAAGADQLSVLGAGGGVLLLGFGFVVAAGLRRRQQLIGRLLARRGASGAQLVAVAAWQPLFAVGVGTVLGVLAGGLVVGVRGSGLVERPWSEAGSAVAAQLPTVALLGLAAVAITVAVTRWPDRAARSTQLLADAALLVALAGAVLIVVGGGTATSSAAVIVLLTVATGLIAARLWGPVAALVGSGGPVRTLAMTGGRRRPLLSMVTAAFVAAACCSLIFAGTYRQSLEQSALDQAAAQVPLDVSVSSSSQVSTPARVVDPSRLTALSDQVRVHPVMSAAVTAFAGSSLASSLPLVGIDPSALPELHEYAATTGSDLPAVELAGRLTTDRAPVAAPVIPAGTGRLSVPATGVNENIVVGLWVVTPNGDESQIALRPRGGRLVAELGAHPALTVRAVEISQSSYFLMHRQHGVGEGSSDRALASGTVGLGAVSADGRPLDWVWSDWGSDQAEVTATGARLTADYRIEDTRVVMVPGYAPLSELVPIPVAVDPQTADRAGASGRVGLTLNGRVLPAQVVAVLPRLPGFGPRFALADRGSATELLSRVAPGTAYVSQVWISAPGPALAAVRADLDGSPAATATVRYRDDLIETIARDPVATRSILLLTVSGAIALLLAAVACAAAARAHRDEAAAELLAVELDGLVPAALRRVVLVRSGLALALGIVVGVIGGLALAAATVPLVVTGPGGVPVSPPLRVVFALGPTVGVVAAAAALGLAGCALVALTGFRHRTPQLPEVDLR